MAYSWFISIEFFIVFGWLFNPHPPQTDFCYVIIIHIIVNAPSDNEQMAMITHIMLWTRMQLAAEKDIIGKDICHRYLGEMFDTDI